MTVRIVAAAVKFGDLVISLPAPDRHHHIIHAAARLRGKPGSGDAQGFLTSEGRFVDRKAAWAIAEAAGQLLERAPTDKRGGTLYSEDVW